MPKRRLPALLAEQERLQRELANLQSDPVPAGQVVIGDTIADARRGKASADQINMLRNALGNVEAAIAGIEAGDDA